MGYILTTGANWAKPIGKFKLTIDREPNTVISLCWDKSLRKVGPNRFQAVKENFLPKKDLDIIGDIIDEEDDVDYSESLDSKEQEKKNNINISRVVSIPTEQEEEFNDRIDTNLDVSDILNVSKLPIEEIPVLVTKT